MQGSMALALKKRASKQAYQSLTQLTIEGFETPFMQKLDPENRWVKLAHKVPWDDVVGIYLKQLRNQSMGASAINPRVILGAVMIKHLKNLSDEETILEIQENMYLQYFIGYSSFTKEAPFDPSLFVEIRNRLGYQQLGQINERIALLHQKSIQDKLQRDNENYPGEGAFPHSDSDPKPLKEESSSGLTQQEAMEESQANSSNAAAVEATEVSHKGRLLVDATACPQDIQYPTDLNLLNDARIKSEELIDLLHQISSEKSKPRTYRLEARRNYLRFAKKRQLSHAQVRKALAIQLRYLRRNLKHINTLLDSLQRIPFKPKEYKYFLVIQEVYRQQLLMWNNRNHRVENRIVSIHQPHVRPIVRGKARNKTEFGAKLHLSLIDGFAFVDHLNWDAYNEGSFLLDSVEKYRSRFGYYPKQVLADQLYCTRENRRKLKELNIQLLAKPLGRPSAVNQEHVRPGERNPIEGKFGQAKTAYGMDRIRARLSQTSESWIASIVLVLNLVQLARKAPYCLSRNIINFLSEWMQNQIKSVFFVIRTPVLIQ